MYAGRLNRSLLRRTVRRDIKLKATQFTKSVDEYVCLLSEFAELDGRTDPESNKRRTEIDARAGREFGVLHRQEWDIRTQLQFAPNNEDDVMRAAQAVLAEAHRWSRTRPA
jgi:hypothetical protein